MTVESLPHIKLLVLSDNFCLVLSPLVVVLFCTVCLKTIIIIIAPTRGPTTTTIIYWNAQFYSCLFYHLYTSWQFKPQHTLLWCDYFLFYLNIVYTKYRRSATYLRFTWWNRVYHHRYIAEKYIYIGNIYCLHALFV